MNICAPSITGTPTAGLPLFDDLPLKNPAQPASATPQKTNPNPILYHIISYA